MGNLSWKEIFRDPKLQMLIEEGLANNVDMQAAYPACKGGQGVIDISSFVLSPFFGPCSTRFVD